MIEVNLHPGGGKKKRDGGALSGLSISLPDLDEIGGLDTLRSDPWHGSFVLFLVIVPLVVGFLWYQQSERAERLDQRLESALADSARLADLRTLSDSITSRRQLIQERIALVRELDQNRFAWPHLMDEVSQALPNRAWLTSITRQSGLPDLRVRIEGAATSPLVITQFVRALEGSSFVSDVRIENSQRGDAEGMVTQDFELSVGYRTPPPSAVERRPLATGGS